MSPEDSEKEAKYRQDIKDLEKEHLSYEDLIILLQDIKEKGTIEAGTNIYWEMSKKHKAPRWFISKAYAIMMGYTTRYWED